MASSGNRSNKKQTAGKRSLEEEREDDKKTATAPSLSPLDPTIEAVPVGLKVAFIDFDLCSVVLCLCIYV